MANDNSNKDPFSIPLPDESEHAKDKSTSSVDDSLQVHDLLDDAEEMLQFGTWQWDALTNMVTWSDGLYRIMGYEREHIGHLVSDEFYLSHLDPFDADELRQIRSNAIATRSPYEYTCRVRTHDGRELVITIKMKFLFDNNGRIIRGVGMCRDVTEKTQMLRDLMHYKKMVVQKEEFLNLGTWELDLETNKMTWSDGMFRLMGYAPQENDHEIDLSEFYRLHLSDEEVRRTNEAIHEVMEKGETYILQSAITRKDGTVKAIETFAKVQKNMQDKPFKILGITRDVTKLKEYEQELEIKLEALNRSNHELEEFAYVASHDLQEPLRKLTTFGERLRNRCGDQLSEEGVVYLNRMMASAESMRELIDNLLEVSRVTRIQHPFVKADLREIVREVLEELDLSIEDAHASVSLHQLPAVEVIPMQIKQLFNNLVTNALKFRKPEVSLQVSIRSEKLTKPEKDKLKLRTGKTYHKITVTDNGIGFEELYAEKIFQLFQRLHGKAEYPGSGIGLAICRKIADNHQGLIMAASEPGMGATFTIVLPEKHSP